MKKIKAYAFIMILVFAAVCLLSMKTRVSAREDRTVVTIDGIQYNLERKNYAIASIDFVRGNGLKTELYIPNQVEYQGETYKVRLFYWGDARIYSNRNYTWADDISISDKEHSYFHCLKKITFANGVLVKGYCYGYEQLQQVTLENPNNMLEAYYNNCPKLESLFLPEKMMGANIKNCPSLQLRVAPQNKYIMVLDGAIYSKDGKQLVSVYRSTENYYIREGVESLDHYAMWGDETIRHLYLPDSLKNIDGVDHILNLQSIHFGKKIKSIDFEVLRYTRKLKRIDFPKNIWKIRGSDNDMNCVNKVYIYAKKLHKNTYFSGNTKKFTFYVKNSTVRSQLRKKGFKGKIVIRKNMKYKK